ncbi:MAG: hypothetical protein IKB36_00540 [Clostridia bacterium]|nr:hypothetical protein [Clostridia bacterium]
MKRYLPVISLLLCFALLFSGCKGEKEPEETEQTTETTTESVQNTGTVIKDGKISLPFNKTDGLNPYFAKSNENLYLCNLLYEPLFSVDSTYKANPVLAETINVNGTTATVTIRTDAECRGSNPINAYDVVYSFNMAKASYAWSGMLSSVNSATAMSNNSIQFNLSFNDQYVANKLTFPIVKSGTADTQSAVPTGSGDYYYIQNNLKNVGNADKNISLFETDTNKSSENAFKIGKTDVYFNDLSNCNYTSVNGADYSVQLNNMVYVGLNSARGALTKHVRSAIAAQINAEEIAISSYQGHATPIKLPVNPESAIAKEIKQIDVKSNKTLAESILDKCGFINYSGKAKTNGAYLLSFTLIVNNDNRYRVAAAYNIADSLKECGFLITVLPLSFADYNQRIASGNFDMYLGEIKLDSSMDISQFFGGGAQGMGIDKTERVVTEYYKFRAGEITAQQYFEIFSEYYPFVPVCFRKGYAVFSGDINPQTNQFPNNIYSGI